MELISKKDSDPNNCTCELIKSDGKLYHTAFCPNKFVNESHEFNCVDKNCDQCGVLDVRKANFILSEGYCVILKESEDELEIHSNENSVENAVWNFRFHKRMGNRPSRNKIKKVQLIEG